MKSIRGAVIAAFIVAALALTPAAASASAGVTAQEYPATLHGSGVGNLTARVGSHEMLCSGLGFEATLKAAASPSANTSSVTNPSCGSAYLKFNGCQLELNPSGHGSLGIGPGGCGSSEVFFGAGCPGLTLPAQSIPATYENVGSDSTAKFRIVINASGVEYVSPSNNSCATKGTHNDLILKGEVEVSATGSGGKSIGTSAITGGLYLGGGPSEAGRLEAAKYPATVTGTRLKLGSLVGQVTLLKTSKYSWQCDVAEYDGGELSGPASSFSLNAAYSGCSMTGGGLKVTAKMNSCRYVYSGIEYKTVNEYKGAASIACNEGDAITISLEGNCTLRIGAQALSGTDEWTNLDLENKSSLIGGMFGSGVKYTSQGGILCSLLGIKVGTTYEDGSLESDMLLSGVFPG